MRPELRDFGVAGFREQRKDWMSDLGFATQLADDLSPEDLRMVLSVFRTDVERLTVALSGAAQAGDVVAFRRAAHGLAGAAGAVGAVALERACREAMDGDGAIAAAMLDIGAIARVALGDLARILAGLDARP
jgi:hypothetical protein